MKKDDEKDGKPKHLPADIWGLIIKAKNTDGLYVFDPRYENLPLAESSTRAS